MLPEPKPNLIIFGAGRLFFNRLDADGNSTGERYLGDTTEMTVTVNTETTSVFSGDGAVAQKIQENIRSVEREATITVHEMSPENWALFLNADSERIVRHENERVADELMTVMPGHWHTLGDGDALLALDDEASFEVSGVRSNSSIPAENNWTVDYATGRIKILEGGAITPYEKIKVSYTKKAAKTSIVTSADPKIVRGAVRYIEDAGARDGRNIYIPNALLTAAGDTSIKSRETEQQITLRCSIKPRAGDGADMIVSGTVV